MADEAGSGSGGSGALSQLAQGTAARVLGKTAAPTGSDEMASLFGLDPEALAAGGGVPAIDALKPEEIIAGLLEETSLELIPNSGFEYGVDELPSWFPKPLRPFVADLAATNVYDPYLGITTQGGDERVYMGERDEYRREIDPDDVPEVGHESKLYGDAYAAPKGEKTPTGKKRDSAITYEQALNKPYVWSDEKVESAMKRMREAGLPVTKFEEMRDAWAGLVDRAAKMYSLSAGTRKVTPWDVLELSKKEALAAGNFTDFENGTQTQTATSVADVSEGASWKVLRNTLSTLLGRDPTDQELRDYTYRMNSLAARNPTISETITQYEAGRAVSSDTTTTGGFDADDMAQAAYEEAQADPEYAKIQSGTTYYNALISAIGAVGDV